jgi:hypothetical protein
VRAWNSQHYWSVGGHREKYNICDDIDLVCRLYCAGPVVHVPESLYRYQMHGQNTWWINRSDMIPELVGIYREHIEQVLAVHATRESRQMIQLNGDPRLPWAVSPAFDPVSPWPFDPESVAAFRSLRCPAAWFREAWRCLAPGGLFVVQMPNDDVQKAVDTFRDTFHPIFVERVGDQESVLHLAALKDGYHPFSN